MIKQNDEDVCVRCSHNGILVSKVHSMMEIQHNSCICLLLVTAKLRKLAKLNLENEDKYWSLPIVIYENNNKEWKDGKRSWPPHLKVLAGRLPLFRYFAISQMAAEHSKPATLAGKAFFFCFNRFQETPWSRKVFGLLNLLVIYLFNFARFLLGMPRQR